MIKFMALVLLLTNALLANGNEYYECLKKHTKIVKELSPMDSLQIETFTPYSKANRTAFTKLYKEYAKYDEAMQKLTNDLKSIYDEIKQEGQSAERKKKVLSLKNEIRVYIIDHVQGQTELRILYKDWAEATIVALEKFWIKELEKIDSEQLRDYKNLVKKMKKLLQIKESI